MRGIPVAVVCLMTATPLLAVDGAIPIWEPMTITQPGRYVLTRNIVAVAGQSAIQIDESGVEIDLNGFTIVGSDAPVIVGTGRHEITIRSGRIEGGTACILLDDVRDVVIEELSIESVEGAGIHLTPSGPYRIAGNTFNFVGGADNPAILVDKPAGAEGPGEIENNRLRWVVGGIRLTGGGSDVVRGNGIEYTFTDEAISVENCDACVLSDNKLTYFEVTGMLLRNCDGCVVSGNLMVAPEGLDGIVLEDSSASLVERNTVSKCRTGILASGTNLSQFERNVLSGNSSYGLWFNSASSQNTYGRNTARGNAGTACTVPVGFDFCNEGSGNSSFNDNFLPGQM